MNYRDVAIGFVVGVLVTVGVFYVVQPVQFQNTIPGGGLPYSAPGGGPTVFPGGGAGVSDPAKEGTFSSPGGPSFSAPTVDKK